MVQYRFYPLSGARPASVALFGLLGLALLSGCAAIATHNPVQTQTQTRWTQHAASVSAIAEWDLVAKVAVKSGAEGGTATLRWAYRGSYQVINIAGPFGSGRVKIVVQPETAVLTTAKGATMRGSDAEQLLYRLLGWRVPFAQLGYWVRGIPSRGGGEIALNPDGSARALHENGWKVSYQSYQSQPELGAPLPRKLSLTAEPKKLAFYNRRGEYLGDQLRVTVIAKRWRNLKTAPDS